MTVSTPCLIFTSLVGTEIGTSELAATIWACLVGYGLMTLAFGGLIAIARLRFRTYLPPLLFGNTGNLGLPLAYFAFGQEGLGFAIVIFAFMAVYSFSFGVWVVSGGGNPINMFREPLVPATLLGALFLLMDWDIPVWVNNTLQLVGQLAIPLMLITLGVALSRLHLSRLGKALWLSIIRLATCVAIGVFAGRLLSLSPIPFAVLVLQLSTPVAVTTYFLAEKYGTDSEEIAGFVIVSTMLSIFAIPITLAMLLAG